MRAHDCTPAFLTILGWIASPGLALPCLRLAPGLALLASAGVAPGLAFKPHLPCLLPLLLVSPVLSGPPTPPPESPLSLPEKIFNKIVSGMRKSVVRAGNTCGQPKINSQMKNLTVDIGETARFQCAVDMSCLVSYIQWWHQMGNGSQRLLRTGSSSGNPYSFIVKDVSWMDEGFYTCMAGNTIGETVSQAYLHISSASRCLPVGLLLALALLPATLLQLVNN